MREQEDGSLWERTFERTPGGKVLPVAGVPSMREREVEIHHADLGLARTAREWSSAFATDLLQARLAAVPERSLRVHATDLDRTWQSGPGGQAAPGTPVVHGTVADLAWWLTGREGRGLTSDDGVVPGIEEW